MREHEEKRTEAQEIDRRIAESMAPGEEEGWGKKSENGWHGARLLPRWKRIIRTQTSLADRGTLVVYVSAGGAAAGRGGLASAAAAGGRSGVETSLAVASLIRGLERTER